MKASFLGVALGLVFVCAASRGGSGGCDFNLAFPVKQDAPVSCNSYTNCQNATMCTTGVVFKNCGMPDCGHPRFCTKYSGGTFNPATGLCEGGTQISTYTDGTICFHISPVGCAHK